MLNIVANSYTLRIVILGIALLGVVSGVMGVFITLRKQSLIGDALSHAALPGIILAYIITENASLYVLIFGAFFAAVISIVLIESIKKYSIIKNDALLAIILSSMFGLGQVLLSIIRDTAGQDQARLKSFIFGQAAIMSLKDVFFLGIILSIILVVVLLFWRHLKLFIFDRSYYQSLGFSGFVINIIINALTILVVVSGIQSVGVILMSALLIAPGVTARLWSHKLSINVFLSALIGLLAGVLGTLLGTNISTGPVIVIFASVAVFVSILIAPKKGILWRLLNQSMHRYQIKKYHLLIHLFETDDITRLKKKEIIYFIKNGYIDTKDNNYVLTPKGFKKVFSIMVGDSR